MHGHHHHGARDLELAGLKGAILVNVAIVIAEAAGGYLTGSLALLADAGHNLTDVGALVLAYLACRFATLPATSEKSFGYYRLEILSALANGASLVLISAFIFFEAWRRFLDPPTIPGTTVLVVATVGLVGNLIGMWLLHRRRESLNIKGAYLHLLWDSVSSVGVVAAALAVIFFGFNLADVIVSVVIGAIIVVSSVDVIRESVDILLQAVPREVELEEVKRAVEDMPDVIAVHDVHVWSLTSGRHVATLHAVVPAACLPKSDKIIRAICRRLHDDFGVEHTTVQLESPDFEDVGHVHD